MAWGVEYYKFGNFGSKEDGAKRMKKRIEKMIKIVVAILLIILIIIGISFINHRIQLAKERTLLVPMGQLVEVDGHKMSVYTEGSGEKTIVFMSGGGTCSPILDFKSLYSQLSDDYRIVVIEKFGYGFSDVIDEKRDVDTILENSREALIKAGVEGPYILCPHSMSGIEALHWANQYPQEVSAIIGLDMAVPKAYEDYKISMPIVKLGHWAQTVGITRLIPNIEESEAIRYGTLSEDEKSQYRAVFHQKTATITMIREVESIKAGAKLVEQENAKKPLEIPVLLFISNGTGTGWDAKEWKTYQLNFLEIIQNGDSIELDAPHYVHDHEYVKMSQDIKTYLLSLEK